MQETPLAPCKTLSVEGAGGKLKEEGSSLPVLVYWFGILVSSVVHAVVFPLIPQVLGGGTYIRLSGSMGSTSIDSTNCRSKILKNQKDSKKLNLNLQYTGNYLRIIYIVFTSICTAFTLNCK